jgi:hypothetical protein
MARLYTIDLRLNRAQKCLDELKAGAGEFLEGNPYQTVQESDLEKGVHIFRVRITKTPPLEFSIIAAECIHHLRASLDNFLWKIARDELRVPRDKLGRLYFPVCASEKSWLGKKTEFAEFFRPEIIDFLDSLQPYHAVKAVRGGIRANRIWVLNRLSNDEKHQAPSLLEFAVIREGRFICEAEHTTKAFPGHKDNAMLVKVTTKPDAEVKIETDFVFDIAFGPNTPCDGEPLIDFLQVLHDTLIECVLAPFPSARP